MPTPHMDASLCQAQVVCIQRWDSRQEVSISLYVGKLRTLSILFHSHLSHIIAVNLSGFAHSSTSIWPIKHCQFSYPIYMRVSAHKVNITRTDKRDQDNHPKTLISKFLNLTTDRITCLHISSTQTCAFSVKKIPNFISKITNFILIINFYEVFTAFPA